MTTLSHEDFWGLKRVEPKLLLFLEGLKVHFCSKAVHFYRVSGTLRPPDSLEL